MAKPDVSQVPAPGAGVNTSATAVASDPRLTTMGLLAELYGALADRLTRQAAEHGLAPAEFEVLLRLVRSDGLLRMSDLAAQAALTTSGITRVVDRLTERGLVARQACPTDRRVTYAVVTDTGRERTAALLPGHLEVIETWLTGPLLAAGELGAFTATLRRLRDRAAPEATAGADDPGPVSRAGAPAGS